ncbi:LBL_2463 family protein [Leptospira stimsonii]|uniref:GNAT family N-acetyltransferase n=1 Tax=Leptospira stimsonii TaxID=2202203 RepID=A0A396YNH5_9LEPT|nr:hypothetical protein [Leptospira stimsonii]RHX84752.1 hypothetical protein DLM75_22325 [Leptospira stimsonii]
MSHLVLEKSSSNIKRKETDFQCRKIVGLENPNELKRVKEFIHSVFVAGGYTKSAYTAVDLDLWSTWFYVVNSENQILSAMRVVEKKPNNFLPIEMAVIDGSYPPRRYALIEENAADWNNVAFLNSRNGWRAAVLNFSTVAKHCLEKKYDTTYGFYDPKMKSIVRIYSSAGAKVSKVYNQLVFFPGSLHNDERVLLNIIEIPKASLQIIASKIP